MRYVFAFVLFLFPLSVSASTCSPREPGFVVAHAEVAFVGVPTEVTQSDYNPRKICWEYSKSNPDCGGKLVKFDVQTILKGNVGNSVSVLVEDGCYCLGPYINLGEGYLVIAAPNSTEYAGEFVASNICWGTGEISNDHSQKVLKEFRNGSE